MKVSAWFSKTRNGYPTDLLVAFRQPFVDVLDARVRRSGGGKGLGVVFANPWQFTGILLR
jgi:hypothetical protein